MLKIAKNGLILHKWAVLASVGFFSQVPPIRLRPRRGPTGTENFESPPIKNLEKKPCYPTLGKVVPLIFFHENDHKGSKRDYLYALGKFL